MGRAMATAPAPTMIPPASADDFLARAGWEGARIVPLAGDASFRRYFRVHHDAHGAAVLMDAPPPHEDPRPFIAVAEWLTGRGFSAPDILARDLDAGLLLLADFGDSRLRETLDDAPDREAELYAHATDLLVDLHGHAPMPGLPPHGRNEWLTELELFPDWYAPAVGIEVDHPSYRSAWEEVLAPVAADGLGPVTVLRDYHAENIMLVAGRAGVSHLGLLDFQDALAGHPAYDLASVLEDARRDVSPAIERQMLDRYIAATGQGDAFERAYWALAAQRNTRILGVFCRLWKRDGKPGYRRFQPRMWGLLERDLAAPGLAPVRAWFNANVPPAARAAAWGEAA
jgi:aminoglycoside/choline kinase family phosphotransferase